MSVLQRAGRAALRPLAVLATVAALLGAAGLETSVAADAVVTIGASLDPIELTVAPGTQVTWENADGDRHRIRSTAGPEEFDSGNLDPGERFSFTFASVGSYEYRDARNSDASQYHGRIVVTAGAPPSNTGGGGSSGETGTGGASSAPTAVQVDIRNRAFAPSQVAVAAGGTVTWRNSDDRVHTATANDRSWDSGIFDTGGSFTQTFNTPGTVSYFCVVHPDMTATVVVVDGATSGETGTQPAATPTPAANSTPASTPTPAPGTGAGSPTPGAASVAIVDFDYRARTLEVAVGTTVNWRNDGTAPHTVTARDRSYDSGLLFTADTYSQTYPIAGSFEYFCTIHPEMVGTVVVGAGSGGSAPTNSASNGPPTSAPPAPASDSTAAGSGTTDDTEADRNIDGGASSAELAATAIDFGYLPETIEIEVGTTVTWTNDGEAPHTITARDQAFDSDLLFTGDSFGQTFSATGSFEYFCTLHPNMVGTVLVRERIAGAPTESGAAAESASTGDRNVDGGAGNGPAASITPAARDSGVAQIILATALILAAVVALFVTGALTMKGFNRT